MTDDLTMLLHSEADALRVPGPPVRDVIGAGRRLRRRRHGTGIVVATAVVVAGALGVSALRAGPDTRFEPADAGALAGTTPTFVGRTVHLGGDTEVTLDDHPVALLYSSAGLVVLTSPDVRGLPPYHLTLVSADGTARSLGVTLDMPSIGTEVGTPYVTWAQRTSDGFDVVVHDVSTGQELARVPVHGPYLPPSGPGQMRMSVDGDLVYVIADHGGYVVDWRTGQVTAQASLGETRTLTVRGGHLLDEQTHQVVDVRTGETLLDFGARANALLSPDGRYVEVQPWTSSREDAMTYLYDVGTGRRVALTGTFGSYGWTPDGRPLGLVLRNGAGEAPEHEELEVTCDPVSGQCDGSTYPYVWQQIRRTGQHGVATGIGGVW
jgi:hypothetical protein